MGCCSFFFPRFESTSNAYATSFNELIVYYKKKNLQKKNSPAGPYITMQWVYVIYIYIYNYTYYYSICHAYI